LKAERERGITIDIALWKFETPKYYVTVSKSYLALLSQPHRLPLLSEMQQHHQQHNK
jgi:hypothetical protein